MEPKPFTVRDLPEVYPISDRELGALENELRSAWKYSSSTENLYVPMKQLMAIIARIDALEAKLVITERNLRHAENELQALYSTQKQVDTGESK